MFPIKGNPFLNLRFCDPFSFFIFLTDDKSTLFVAFRVLNSKRDTSKRRYAYPVGGMMRPDNSPLSYRLHTDSRDPVTGFMMEKLASFPTAPKLLVTPTWNTRMQPSKELGEIPESLHVEYRGGEGTLSTIVEVLSKRWQTLDLISIMKEVQRTVSRYDGNKITKITENLSTIPRFQPTPEQS